MRALATALLLLPLPAGAVPMSAWSKASLREDFARMRYTTAQRVLELRAFDLSRAPGVKGFTLGRSRVKEGKWIQGGLVIYYKSGKGLHMWGRSLGPASKVRHVALVDLARKETLVPTNRHSWGASTVKQPASKARWPVLIVQAENLTTGRQRHETYLVSLKEPAKPRLLLRLTTLSRRRGEPRRSVGRKGRRSVRLPRYAGTRVGALRFTRRKGAAPELQITEKLISTQYNRCKEPKPKPTRYLLQEGRFVRQPGKPTVGGCR